MAKYIRGNRTGLNDYHLADLFGTRGGFLDRGMAVGADLAGQQDFASILWDKGVNKNVPRPKIETVHQKDKSSLLGTRKARLEVQEVLWGACLR